MRVLVACETSRRVASAFERRGHYALSCDLLEADSTGPHYRGDVRDVLGEQWDLLISFPPCTYTSASGLHWNKRRPGRADKTAEAVAFARMLIGGPEVLHIPRRAMENPKGCLSTYIRPADQIVQPWMFGDDASKATCLWLYRLPPLQALPTAHRPPPRWVRGEGARWGNQTDSGQNKLPPQMADRAKRRAVTYRGIADAMARTWGVTEISAEIRPEFGASENPIFIGETTELWDLQMVSPAGGSSRVK